MPEARRFARTRTRTPAPHPVTNEPTSQRRRLLVTAGPTQEPIDAVRYIGNRSSGRLGCSLAERGARSGWTVDLLLGPTPREPRTPLDSHLSVQRFRTTSELQRLLREHAPRCDVLVMAAAVADYKPLPDPKLVTPETGKLRRGGEMILRLEATPDLLAEAAASKRPDQLFVGFALEPRERLLDSARSKLERKGIDLIVANPLETMDAETIEATLLARDGQSWETGGAISKTDFAPWLLERIEAALAALAS